MKIERWTIVLVVSLLFISASSYLSQIYLFNKIDDTLFYLMQDFSFVPIQVLLVTLILDKILRQREKKILLKKMNMAIGIFYHEIGLDFLSFLKELIKNFKDLSFNFKISNAWLEKDFKLKSKKNFFKKEQLNLNQNNFAEIKIFLLSKKNKILNLLSNPNLLDHDDFTNLLWAVFHLTDEMFHRESFENLPPEDLEHLKGDLIRAYNSVLKEWFSYLNHLRKDYPFLYSIALRTNPLNPEADIVVKN